MESESVPTELPVAANLLKLVSARNIEIKAMTENILKPTITRRIFQTLPIHMRRRVMSHNCKRLPRRLRELHADQIKKSGEPPKQKRPSRNHRRRPRNLMSEYERRKRKVKWLESHLWHAKRFFMVERWGHKLAERPCDKAFRACYRASSLHCIIQDISFYVSFKLTGYLTNLDTGFNRITSKECGLSISSVAYRNGQREGSAHIYKMNSYPNSYIGKVDFVWNSETEDLKSIIFFIHPAFSEDIKHLLIESFNLNKIKNIYKNNDLELIIINNTYSRFRLTGPKSQAILCETLKCSNEDLLKKSQWLNNIELDYLYYKEKHAYWERFKGLKTPAELPPRMILGLLVEDPRLHRPLKRRHVHPKENVHIPTEYLLKSPDFAKETPMWNLEIIDLLKKDKKSNHELIQYITEHHLVPGTEVKQFQSVPVLLVQRPGSQVAQNKKIGYASGWDLLLPSSYCMAFWHCLILNGARAGGLREQENILFESGQHFLTPDSVAGQNEALRINEERRDKYFRLPPNKRVNYVKFGINSPFLCCWDVLVREWSQDNMEGFYVLRNKKNLKLLQESLTNKKHNSDLPEHQNSLIPVFIEIQGKGSLSQFAVICSAKKDSIVFLEPLRNDKSVERRLLRKVHQKAVLIIRNKRKREAKKRKQLGILKTKSKLKSKIPSEYMLKMRELWLPSKIDKVRKCCINEVAGYVSHGAFSFTESKCCGVGYVTYNALIDLIRNNKVIIVRNPTSRVYRNAQMRVIIE